MSFPDLSLIQEKVFHVCGFSYSAVTKETESAEYNACTFTLNDAAVLFRSAKITPTKIGQFVTVWKRPNKTEIEPFDALDPIDFVIISVSKEKHFGHFVFPKSVLCQKGIFTFNGKEGKRGFRVYPSWDKTTNKQATETQNWQLNFFLDISDDTATYISKAKELYLSSQFNKN